MTSVNLSNGMYFDENSWPPRITVQNVLWLQSIAADQEVRRLFNPLLIQELSIGRPLPAEKVLEVLLHWIKSQIDPIAFQQTYAMRLRLDASVYQYASRRQIIDAFSWRALGVCSVGRQVAMRLSASLELSPNAPWMITVLRDWVTTSTDNDSLVACTIGVERPDIRLHFPLAALQKSVFVFLLPGAYLWPEAFPVVESELITPYALPQITTSMV